MGFGFNLGVIFIVIPLLVILFISWCISRKKIFGKSIAGIIIGIATLVLFSSILRTINAQKVLKKKDYYGTYIIDRSYFPGKQADWQYNNFRFEIKENDSIYFHCTDKNKTRKTYKGYISTLKSYKSERIVIHMDKPTHHIMKDNPTIYRSTWDFHMVFNSDKFNNIFFTKGKWSQIPTNK